MMKKLPLIVVGTSLLALSIGLSLFTYSLVSQANQEVQLKAQITCKDFLLEFGDKPQELEFLECKNSKNVGLDALEARYRVSGKDAAKVESLLQQKFQMSKLKFLCCGWESIFVTKNGSNTPGKGYYTDNYGYRYTIDMHSEETLVNERENWQNIPYFYITVTAFLEDF
ncbi:MAG TPA: DUF4952 domain-containing protein [Nostocaceae cyanobacterium]|nr:DUF4952 domain-containing protein [Nostocaceae cyanobacterium]